MKGRSFLLGVALGACAVHHPPPPVQEVPIANVEPPPPQPQVDGEVPIYDDASVDDAAATAIDGGAGGDDGSAGVPDSGSDTPSRPGKHKKGRGKPVALTPTPSHDDTPASEGGGGGDSGRAALEAKVASGHASRQEILQLQKMCIKDKDRDCVLRASRALTRAH